MQKPDEPLEQSAPLARQLAGRLCRRDPATGDDCAWYHGLWQDLRSLGLAAGPDQQRGFFRQAFRNLSDRRRLRVLISGAADYSILAHILWAANEGGLSLAVTVIDLCDTPLFLNRWYAERAGHSITTVRGDVCSYEPEQMFDVVCSHVFLGQFAPPQRTLLVQAWSHLLHPTGRVLAVNRVRPAGTSEEVKFSREQTRAFCAAVKHKARELPSLTASEREELVERARTYARRLRAYAVSRVELLQLFQNAGFIVDPDSAVTWRTQAQDGFTGPAIPSNAEHLCLSAARQGSGSRESVRPSRS